MEGRAHSLSTLKTVAGGLHDRETHTATDSEAID